MTCYARDVGRAFTILTSIVLAFAPARVLAQPADAGDTAYREGRRLYDAQDWTVA